MKVYITSLFLALLFSVFSFNWKDPLEKKTKLQIFLAILSAFPLFFVTSFRYGVGNDYFSYASYFENSLQVQFMEVGFDFLVRTIRSYTNDYVWMFAICSLIFFYFMYRAIYEQSLNPTLTIFIFFCAPYFFEFFSGMRQMIAVAIFLYSIKYIKRRKIVPYVLLILLASSFHSSSLIFLPVYFLYNKRISLHLGLILIPIILVYRPYFANLLHNIISLTNYAKYFDGKFDTGHFGIVTLLVPLFIFLFAIIFYNKKERGKYDKDYQFYCNLMFIQVVIVLVQDLVPLITRIGWGFGISQIILIPYAISKIKMQKNRVYMTMIICLLFVTYVYIMRFNGGGGLLPFRWVFS